MVSGEVIDTVAFLSALGAGLVAGIFFAFSGFVMKALACLPSGQGIRAMQLINVTVLNPWFFSAFFGTALGAADCAPSSAVARRADMIRARCGGRELCSGRD